MKLAFVLSLAVLLLGSPASAIAPPSPGSPSANTVALPGAPGSVQGLTAAGQVSGFSGQYSYSLPVDLPAGRAGFKLSMALTYNGALGNGYMGIGWGFSAPHIKRSTRLGPPTYTDADELELAGIGGGGRLIYLDSGPYQGEYRVEGQGQSVRVEYFPPDVGTDSWFKVTTSDGTIFKLDQHEESGLDTLETCPKGSERPHGTFAWYVSSVTQLGGENGVFTYDDDGGHKRLVKMEWTPLDDPPTTYAYSAEFGYGNRRDHIISYRSGYAQSIDSRLKSITIRSFGNVRRTYQLTYADEIQVPLASFGDPAALSQLHAIKVMGADGLALPEVTFTYGGSDAPLPTATLAEGTGGWRLGERGVTLQDINGDGLSDLARYTPDERSWRLNTAGVFAEKPEPLTGGANVHLDDIRFMDLDGDLTPEMVYIVDDTWRVYHLDGTTYTGGETWPGTDTVPLTARDTMVGDLNGDSRVDIFRATFSGTTLAFGADTELEPPLSCPLINHDDALLEPGDDNLQLHDVNGDGLADIVWLADAYMKVYLGRGDGTFVPYAPRGTDANVTFCYPWNWRQGDYNPLGLAYGCDEVHPEVIDISNIRLADLDRDGLLDLVRVSAGKVYFYSGYWSDPLPPNLQQECEDRQADPDRTPCDIELSPFAAPVVLPRPAGAEYDDVVTIADLNGNGSADVVWSTASGMWILDMAGPATKAMLVAIDNGMGAQTHIDYTTSSLSAIAAEVAGRPWNERLPTTQAMPVQVTSDVPDDPTQPTIVTSYVSRDGFWDPSERIFGGYLEVAETQWGEDDNTTLITTTRFDRGDGSDRVLRGSPYFVQRANALGVVFDETTTSRSVISVTDLPAATSNPLLGVAVTLQETTTVEEGDCTGAKTLRTTYEHDGYGNVTRESKLGDIADTGDQLVTEHDYVSNTTDWVLFKECQSRSYDPATASYFGSRTVTVYEANTTPSGGACAGGAGDGRVRAVYGALCDPESSTNSCGPLSDASVFTGVWVKSVETSYDTWGNPTSVWETGVTRSLTYDSDALVPLIESIGCTPIDVEITSYDYTLGLPLELKDANDDLAGVTYDSLGRVTDTWQDYDEDQVLEHTGSFDYDLTGPRPTITATTDEAGILPDTVSTQVFAASGAPLYTATETTSGWIINGHRDRNVRGLTIRMASAYEVSALPDDNASFPITGPDAVPFQTVAYDAVGRAVEQRLPEVPGAPVGGAVHSVLYQPLKTTTQSSELAAVETTTDGLDRLKHVQRVIGATTEAVNAHWSLYGLAGYTLQPGTAKEVSKSFQYDSLGRVTEDSDLDSGSRNYTWTDEGWLDTITNAQSDVQVFDYDCAGRLTARTGYPQATGLPDETWTFTYDSDDDNQTIGLNNNQVGRLATVSGPGSFFEDYVYDAAGRVASRLRSVPSGSGGSGLQTVTVGMTYSPTGKVLAQQLYDGTSTARIRVETDYDEAGRLRWLGYAIDDDNSTASLYELLDQKASGAPLIERYGNGLGTRFTRDDLDQVTALDVVDVAGGPTWNPATHGPTVPSTFASDLATYDGGFGTTVASDIRYQVGIARNAWGGVTAVTDSTIAPHNPRRDATFDYDTAMRLLEAALGETFDGANSSLGSWFFQYAHDELQNLTKREIVTMPVGSTAPVMAHGTHTHDSVAKRRLTSVASGESFTYDAVGRMVTRNRPGLPTQTLTWDAFDRVRKVADATGGAFVEHLYGADGERMWSGWYDGSSSIREDYRFGGGLELRDGRYELTVSGGGSRTIARISVNQTGTSAPEVVYMHPGVGPGPVVLTDSAGAVLEERLYEPFGTALDDTADFDVEPTGWNAKPVDPWTTWSDHGARWLGTDFGHWLSPDPRTFGEELPNSFWEVTPYVFGGGNPVAFWDPDGRVYTHHGGDALGPSGARGGGLPPYKLGPGANKAIIRLYKIWWEGAKAGLACGFGGPEACGNQIHDSAKEIKRLVEEVYPPDSPKQSPDSGHSPEPTEHNGNIHIPPSTSPSQASAGPDGTVRVRHFTNSKGAAGIMSEGKIRARDQNRVFTVPAKGKPGSPRDVEKKLGIKNGHANYYVDFDASWDEIEVRKNKKTGAREYVFRGDVSLDGRNPVVHKNR